jgi:hypothetical protein
MLPYILTPNTLLNTQNNYCLLTKGICPPNKCILMIYECSFFSFPIKNKFYELYGAPIKRESSSGIFFRFVLASFQTANLRHRDFFHTGEVARIELTILDFTRFFPNHYTSKLIVMTTAYIFFIFTLVNIVIHI